jgi:hypothetical protein
LFVLALVLAVAPAIPVSKAFQPRYAGLAWVAIVAAFAFGCRALLERGRAGRRVAIGLAVFALASSLAVNRAAWGTRYAAAERMSIEARSFLEMRDGDFLRQPRIPAAAMNELRWLKEDALGLPRGARWFADDLFLCEHSERVSRMFEYRDATRRVSEATADLRRTSAAYCGSIREAALEADLAWRDGDFSWQLGPYADGRWSIVYGDGVERFDVAPRDGYRHHASVFNLRIRYESPQGWLTFSPNIPLDFRASPRVHWKREARSES